MKPWTRWAAQWAAALLLTVAGSAYAQTVTYSVTATVSGLAAGKTLCLQNNATDTTCVASNGAVTFATKLATKAAYKVTVSTAPVGQTCTVTNGTGTISKSNITNVAVACATTYSVSGTISGLTAAGLVLKLNTTSLTVASGASTFAFSTALANGAAYAVTVGTQPTGLTCTVANGSGTINAANVTNVAVTCAASTVNTYTVGGSVSGNTGSVTITNSGVSPATTAVVASGGGAFTLPAQASGSNWTLAVTSPTGQSCTVSPSSGTNITANVTNVSVTCTTATNTHTVGGSVSGLVGSVTLLNNGGDALTVSANGNFTFKTGLAPLATYEVTVGTQPVGQTCAVFNASGTMISISYVPTAGTSVLNVTNISVTCVSNPAYTGTVMLGAPTDSGIVIKLFSADQSGSVSVSYGVTSGSNYTTTSAVSLVAGTPTVIKLAGLSANTRYYYLVNFTPTGGSTSQTSVYQFNTARAKNSTFAFTVQADSHLDENTDALLYFQTLRNMASNLDVNNNPIDIPDFLIDLGDTFMTEKHNEALDPTPVSGSTTQTGSPPASTEQQVIARYRMELKYFDIATRTVPLFLANGNHDAELGWIWGLTKTSVGITPTLASWAAKNRATYYVNPDPSTQAFYKGQTTTTENTATTPAIPARTPAAWYSWEWGDALFVVIDPYWNSASNLGWDMSLGKDQYTWLQATLSGSTAKYKFVFLHNLVGGLSSMRGGSEAAPLFEWGGYDATLSGAGTTTSPFTAVLGSNLFASKRPGWAMPIHSLLVANKVTAVFHGHDHVYGQQKLDGIVYQEVPQPSAKNTSSGVTTAAGYGYNTASTNGFDAFDSSSGHLRITVSPTQVKTEYVRAWLPVGTVGSSNVESATKKNKQISQSWTCTYQSSGVSAGWCL